MVTCTTTDLLEKQIQKKSVEDTRHNGLIQELNDLDPALVVKYILNGSMLAEDTESDGSSGSNSEEVDNGIYEDFVNIVGGNSGSTTNGNASEDIEIPSTTPDSSTESTDSPTIDENGDNLEIGGDYGVDEL